MRFFEKDELRLMLGPPLETPLSASDISLFCKGNSCFHDAFNAAKARFIYDSHCGYQIPAGGVYNDILENIKNYQLIIMHRGIGSWHTTLRVL